MPRATKKLNKLRKKDIKHLGKVAPEHLTHAPQLQGVFMHVKRPDQPAEIHQGLPLSVRKDTALTSHPVQPLNRRLDQSAGRPEQNEVVPEQGSQGYTVSTSTAPALQTASIPIPSPSQAPNPTTTTSFSPSLFLTTLHTNLSRAHHLLHSLPQQIKEDLPGEHIYSRLLTHFSFQLTSLSHTISSLSRSPAHPLSRSDTPSHLSHSLATLHSHLNALHSFPALLEHLLPLTSFPVDQHILHIRAQWRLTSAAIIDLPAATASDMDLRYIQAIHVAQARLVGLRVLMRRVQVLPVPVVRDGEKAAEARARMSAETAFLSFFERAIAVLGKLREQQATAALAFPRSFHSFDSMSSGDRSLAAPTKTPHAHLELIEDYRNRIEARARASATGGLSGSGGDVEIETARLSPSKSKLEDLETVVRAIVLFERACMAFVAGRVTREEFVGKMDRLVEMLEVVDIEEGREDEGGGG